jgi:hypothetical protein
MYSDYLRYVGYGNLYEFNYENPLGYVDDDGYEPIPFPILLNPIGITIGVGAGICYLIPSCRSGLANLFNNLWNQLKTRDKQPDNMGGCDNDPFKGKGPKKGTDEYEKWKRQLEKDKAKEGRGGKDNPTGPFEPPL